MGKVYADLKVNGGFIYNNNPTDGYILSTDGTGHISFTQSDVIESSDYASLPVSGLGSRLYVTTDNNNVYRWDGAAYQPIISGSSQTSGTSGTSGDAGTSGTSGTSGIGSSGTSGTSGSDGSSGTSGENGSSGTSGENGSSGTSGTSGLLSLSGSTDNGVITLDGVAPNATVESNLTFDGSLLNVSGSIFASSSTSEGLVKIYQNGSGNSLVVQDSLYVDSIGRVGIGSSGPSDLLTIGSVGEGGGFSIYGTSSGHVHIRTRDNIDTWTASLPPNKGHISNFVYNNFGGEIMLNDGQGNLYFGTTPSLHLPENYFWIGNTYSYAYPRLLSGDVYSDYTGTITINNHRVSYNKMQLVSKRALLGSLNVTGGIVEEIPINDSFIGIGTASQYLGSASNWSGAAYSGPTITGTFQGQFHATDQFLYMATDDDFWVRMPKGYFEVIHRDCFGDSETVVTGTSKYTFRMPFPMQVTEARASLSVSGSGGGVTEVDINCDGSSIFSTGLTIDSGEKTSKTAVASAVISASILPDDSEITVDVDQVSSSGGEKGLKISLIGWRRV